jgi:hypothetical protein
MRCIGALLLVLSCLFAGTPARARPSYELTVRLDVDRRSLSGHARITFINGSASALSHVLLWSYPDRFAVRPAALNDYNLYWIYPYRYNPASLTVDAVRVAGQPATVILQDHPQAGPRTVLEVTLPKALPPGATAELDIEYHVHLPDRYGAFGCFRHACVLGGGFYPMLPPLGPAGFDLNAPPARADFTLALTAAQRSDVIIQGELTTLPAGDTRRAEVRNARALTVAVRRPAFRTESLTHRGVRILYHVAGPRPVRTPPDFVLPYWPADRPGRVLATARAALDLLADLGLPLPVGQDIHLFEGALRIEVAQSLPGAVLVSDRIFDLFPLPSLIAAHEDALLRAIFDDYAERRLGSRERPQDEGWAPDVAASFLCDRYARRDNQGGVGRDISKVGFLPEADKILYAPQVPFATTYFYTLSDPDPLRDGLTQFNNDWPRGRTVYAKLLDLLGEKAVEQIVRRYLAGTPIREAAEAVYGGALGWFFAQWLGVYPQVAYRIRDLRKSRAKGLYQVALVVEKRGEKPPIEPVEVQVRDAKGQTQSQVWDGRGSEHRYVFSSAYPIRLILLDPRGRLVEDLPGSRDDLKFGQRLPPGWKVLLGNIEAASVAGSLSLGLAVNLWRVRDLRNSLSLGILHDELNTFAVSGQYTRWFGPKVTPARLAWSLSAGLQAARVPSLGQTGLQSIPGESFTFSVNLSLDDRLYIWEPVRARTLNLGLSYTITVLDNAAVFNRGNATASWESIVRLADGHGLALLLGGGITFGNIATAQQLLSAGGPSALRGFAQSDLLGRASLVGRAEYRHVFTHALNVNVVSTYYLRGISGSLFAEAGFTTACESYAIDKSSPAADVGYTVNFIGEWFGLSPNQFGVGVAVPLLSPQRSCFGMAVATGGSPVVPVLNFGTPW